MLHEKITGRDQEHQYWMSSVESTQRAKNQIFRVLSQTKICQQSDQDATLHCYRLLLMTISIRIKSQTRTFSSDRRKEETR